MCFETGCENSRFSSRGIQFMASGNFTEGKILKPLLQFALPVVFALFLQSLYGAVDVLIVGRFASSADVSAVSTGAQILMTVTSVIAGLSMGTTILIGQLLGRNESGEAGKAVGTGILFFALIALCLSVLMVPGSGFLASLMNAPEEAYEMTVSYIRICSAGLLFITAYNLLGALFRGLGNSRVPLLAVGIAALFNMALDYILVHFFHMGASGAAIATVAAQAFSVMISLALIRGMPLPFTFQKDMIRLNMPLIRQITGFGFPIALADLLVGMSFLIILAIVNSLGLLASAGMGVAEKVCAFIMLVPSAFGQSMASFVAQNYGAGKMDRAHKALTMGIGVSLCFGVFIGWFSFFHGDVLCGIFSTDAEVVAQGWEYLKAYAIDCVLTSFFFCYNGYFNGCGYTRFVMAESIIGAFGVRIPVSYLMSRLVPVSLFRVGLATPASSFVQTVLCIVYMHTIAKRKERELMNGR